MRESKESLETLAARFETHIHGEEGERARDVDERASASARPPPLIARREARGERERLTRSQFLLVPPSKLFSAFLSPLFCEESVRLKVMQAPK